MIAPEITLPAIMPLEEKGLLSTMTGFEKTPSPAVRSKSPAPKTIEAPGLAHVAQISIVVIGAMGLTVLLDVNR